MTKEVFNQIAEGLTEALEYAKLPPAPGSREAVAMGCKCPVLDNAHGRGYLGRSGIYVYTVGCPIHNQPSPEYQPVLVA